MRGVAEITRTEVDRERCCRRPPRARWIMRVAAEYQQESEIGSREVLQKISRGEVDHER